MIRHLFKLVWNRKRANALLMIEILAAFLVVFAVSATLIALTSSYRQPLGYEWQDVWNIRFDKDETEDLADDRGDREEMFRVVDELRALPEIESVAIAMTPPYAMSTNEGSWQIDGRDVQMTFDEVSDEYASVMKMKVVRGRWFEPSDEALHFRPVVLDTNAAARLFPGEDPIGKKYDEQATPELRVVGIVEAYRKDGEFSRPINMAFQRVGRSRTEGRLPRNLVMRLRPGTSVTFEEQLAERVRALVPRTDFRIRHLEGMRKVALGMSFAPAIAGAIVALFLIVMVALGLTGVLWQNVTRRTREIGLRRAVGAAAATVRRQILGEVLLLATLALIVGVIIVLQLPLLGLFAWIDPPIFVAAVVVSLAVIYALALLSGLYPSWLASRVHPAAALHYD